ncbi:thiamine-binding protein [Natronorubrum aibiense]|uniref:Dehydrogenase n=1 Tax=Natronorubrum aibiense TaxID=348826 RepID=A0A5P9P920_9EURY|nr:thiamine-binding protein [Natronorubrum aibiense]QFU84623.1 dehydrogenase [Natronorubrum aibiense]
MTAIARLEIIPVREEHMSDHIAAALDELDQFEISYELTPMDTVIQADDVSEIFAATQAAHEALDEDRIITSLEIDHQPDREQHTADRVAAVEHELGRSAQG